MEENANVCQNCGAQFNSKEELDQHNQETHGGGEQGGQGEMPPQRPPQTPEGGMNGGGDMGGQEDEGGETNRM